LMGVRQEHLEGLMLLVALRTSYFVSPQRLCLK